jgi:hypothetical protein
VGPVERAIRAKLSAGSRLHTISRPSPFLLDKIDGRGIVLNLAMRWPTRLSWQCLEGTVPYLRARGWVRAGGVHSLESPPGSLDEYLKGCVKRDTTNWVVVILREAEVVEVEVGPPLMVRLAPAFA